MKSRIAEAPLVDIDLVLMLRKEGSAADAVIPLGFRCHHSLHLLDDIVWHNVAL